MVSVDLVQVEFNRTVEKYVALLRISSVFAPCHVIPLGTALFCRACVPLHSFTWKNSIFYQGTFASYHARKGAFYYIFPAGDRPRCRSPPTALTTIRFKTKSETERKSL